MPVLDLPEHDVDVSGWELVLGRIYDCAQLCVGGTWLVDFRLSQRLAYPFGESDSLSAGDSPEFHVLFFVQKDLQSF